MASEVDFAETFSAYTLNEQAHIKNNVAKKNLRARVTAINAAVNAADQFDEVELYEDYLDQLGGSDTPSLEGFFSYMADTTDEIRVPTTKALVLACFAPSVGAPRLATPTTLALASTGLEPTVTAA